MPPLILVPNFRSAPTYMAYNTKETPWYIHQTSAKTEKQEAHNTRLIGIYGIRTEQLTQAVQEARGWGGWNEQKQNAEECKTSVNREPTVS